MDNYNYPLGADTSEAPWRQTDNPEVEIEVLVSITLSKSIKIKVSDYDIVSDVDEVGNPVKYIDYSTCNLEKAVAEQYILPQELPEIVNDLCRNASCRYDLTDYGIIDNWHVDEFEVIKE